MPKPIDSSMPDAQVVPEPRLEKRSRRQFSTAYKLRNTAEADQCKRGELGHCYGARNSTVISCANGVHNSLKAARRRCRKRHQAR
jgi:hypothetical protein